jgi:hypothetical protein
MLSNFYLLPKDDAFKLTVDAIFQDKEKKSNGKKVEQYFSVDGY